ncbi:pyridine nucleotide-disulfide oxidoreductase [Chromatocurvus halotolerans]|uniref:Pyridine nucleotide-disulfide oxidoreductase n=2 Tax=Chromatocurvus halotolerans TaxID=1132028 RepID=A0A4R2L7F5_9GAMM|nr:pyridine nucleotide-disulfide oxidoreductase [Chromatocurvus halotolerans]
MRQCRSQILRAANSRTYLNHGQSTGFTMTDSTTVADNLILGPGASPRAQPGRAVVVGAGYIGLEMMEQLHARGVAVTLVELQPQVLPLMDPKLAHMLEEEIASHDIDLRLGDSGGIHVNAHGQTMGPA